MRVNSTDLQNAFGRYLALADEEDVIVTKNGKAVAKLSRFREPESAVLFEEAADHQRTSRISYGEYEKMVEASDQRYELIGGQVYLLASPSYRHQVIVNEIAGRFYNFFQGKPCQSLTSPLDVRLFGHAGQFEENPNVVQPDIVVIWDQDKVRDNKYLGVPTLIVEVVSPSTRGKDFAVKLQLYMESGVKEYWLVDPEEERILLYSFTPERDVAGMTVHREADRATSAVFPSPVWTTMPPPPSPSQHPRPAPSA